MGQAFQVKGRSRASGEFITTEEQVKERAGRREKEILPGFLSEPTDVLQSKRQQAGGKTPHSQHTLLI